MDRRINFAMMIGICLPPLIAVIVWLVTIDNKASAAQEEMRGIRPLILEIKVSIAKIEQSLKFIEKRSKQ